MVGSLTTWDTGVNESWSACDEVAPHVLEQQRVSEVKDDLLDGLDEATAERSDKVHDQTERFRNLNRYDINQFVEGIELDI